MGTIYNKVPEEYKDTYASYFDLETLRKKYKQKEHGFKLLYAKEHPVTFAYFMLGKRLRIYQAYAIDKILNHKRTSLCWARRLGKSTTIGILAFWLTFFNKEPKNSMEKFTEIGIISKEDDAAKKILAAVKQLIYDGDTHMRKVLQMSKNPLNNAYFSNQLSEPTNVSQITWGNRSLIRSLPPTKKVKGHGLSRLFIDEIAYLDPRDDSDPHSFFYGSALPTIADTDGSCCISSTPNGIGNIFYDLHDPFGEKGSEFIGIEFKWTINSDELNYKHYVETAKLNMTRLGREKLFEQEFNCAFNDTQESFFSNEDIDKLFSEPNLTSHYEWKKSKCSIGIDYGISRCATVLTVKTKYRNKILTLYQRRFPLGYDINNLMNENNEDSIPNLCKRYDVEWIIPDDCPQGDSINKQMVSKGYPVRGYSFQNLNDKNKAFYTYRGLLKEDIMRCYPNEQLHTEMLGIREEVMIRNIRIGKANDTSFDDCVDSEIFATIPFFADDNEGFGVVKDEYVKEIKSSGFDITSETDRIDNEWQRLKEANSNNQDKWSW